MDKGLYMTKTEEFRANTCSEIIQKKDVFPFFC